jgi:hypothetical protein
VTSVDLRDATDAVHYNRWELLHEARRRGWRPMMMMVMMAMMVMMMMMKMMMILTLVGGWLEIVPGGCMVILRGAARLCDESLLLVGGR